MPCILLLLPLISTHVCEEVHSAIESRNNYFFNAYDVIKYKSGGNILYMYCLE